jgi:hypothetical protein
MSAEPLLAKGKGAPPFVVRRDRSLDAQLVWNGKDEQDAQPLEVLQLQEALGQRANDAAAVA